MLCHSVHLPAHWGSQSLCRVHPGLPDNFYRSENKKKFENHCCKETTTPLVFFQMDQNHRV